MYNAKVPVPAVVKTTLDNMNLTERFLFDETSGLGSVTAQKPLFREGFRKKIPSLASKNPFAKQILHGFLLVSGRH